MLPRRSKNIGIRYFVPCAPLPRRAKVNPVVGFTSAIPSLATPMFSHCSDLEVPDRTARCQRRAISDLYRDGAGWIHRPNPLSQVRRLSISLHPFHLSERDDRCQRPAFVDREDYTDMPNIPCPQRDCQHVWCKKCEQTIAVDGPKHSCDGSSELDHLMKEKGWKHCPST